jgi:hypothetical protein
VPYATVRTHFTRHTQGPKLLDRDRPVTYLN